MVVLWNLLNPEQAGSRSGLYTNQATDQNDLNGAVDRDHRPERRSFKHVYETWGREIEFKFVKSSGTDETAQRADAVAVERAEAVRRASTLPRGSARRRLAAVRCSSRRSSTAVFPTCRRSLRPTPSSPRASTG